MFTGIVDHQGTIESVETRGDLRVVIACDFSALVIGESIAVNGICLTVVETQHSALGTRHSFAADISAETLSRTAQHWKKGASVNLERALKLGDDISGHMVTGHVDGIATLIESKKSGDSHLLGLKAPKALIKFIAEKGSVTLDGVSLTVNRVENGVFWVNIIPHTWERTTLSERKPKDELNLEIDVIARYVERLLQK